MLVELFIVFALAAPPIVGVVTWVKLRQRAKRLAALVETLRAAVAQEWSYRPVDERDREHGPLLAELNEMVNAAGLMVLGEIVQQPGSRVPTVWFADDKRTTYGMVTRTNGRVMAIVGSRAPERGFTTRMPPTSRLADGPSIRHQDAPANTSLRDLHAKHRASIATASDLVPVTTASDAVREMETLRGMMLAWRDAQPPDLLLEQDLRSFLGKHYGVLGPMLQRRLAPTVPQARVVH